MKGLISLLLGTALGLFGYNLGGALANAVAGPGWSMQAMPAVIVPRMIAFACLGMMLGLGVGISSFSFRVTLSGAFGGLVGGLIAGGLFDMIGQATGTPLAMLNPGQTVETGAAGRAIGFAILGFAIGLFSCLFDYASRQAWIRLVLGRNEGKEWPIDSQQTTIGRDERAHIPLFGDQNIAALHAVIHRNGNQYVLQDAGSLIGTGLNGMRIPDQALLKHGDTINVAGLQLQFLMKSGVVAAHEGRAKAVPVMPSASPSTAQPLQPPSQPTVAIQPTAGYEMVWIDGPMAGLRQPISGTLEIGREGAGVILTGDQNVSRRHALITASSNQVEIHDLNSTNGTFVNGQRVEKAILNRGDLVKIGASTFRLE